jgi:hypothetical protein
MLTAVAYDPELSGVVERCCSHFSRSIISINARCSDTSGSNAFRIGGPGKKHARMPARKVSREVRLSGSGLPRRARRNGADHVNLQHVVIGRAPSSLDIW